MDLTVAETFDGCEVFHRFHLAEANGVELLSLSCQGLPTSRRRWLNTTLLKAILLVWKTCSITKMSKAQTPQ